MKKFIYYIAMSVLFILPSSCSLQEEDRTEVEKKNYMNNAREAKDVLLGVYRTNVEDAAYGYYLSLLFNMGTDIMQGEGSDITNYRIIANNAFPTTQMEVQQVWEVLYKGVYRANDFLERISNKMQNYTSTDQKLATLYIAEARALRAMFYFELIRRYGNISLMTNTAMSHQAPATFVQATPDKVYEFIESDLLYAAEILPYAVDDQLRENTQYRFSKGAALGLLTKVYATWAGYPVRNTAKWEDAAKTASILINSGKHSLLSNYEQLWKNTCNSVWNPAESLIEISFYSPTVSGSSDPAGRIGKWNGVKTTAIAGVRGSCAGNQKVVHSFVLDWREDKNKNDLRRDLSIANYKYDNDYILWAAKATDSEDVANGKDLDPAKEQKNKQNYTPAKWDIEKYATTGKLINNDRSNVNWYFLRYADVLLLYAEALNEWKHGPTTEAYAAINEVRRRGYGYPGNTSECDIPQGLDEKGFREVIQKERAYELAFEGHRRMDLVRWGIYYETIQKTRSALADWWTTDGDSFRYLVQQYTVKNKHELLPIPQHEMDLCILFNQNPGWK